MESIIHSLPTWQLTILGIFAASFLFQVIYWLQCLSISRYRNKHRLAEGAPLPAVSVVVVMDQHTDFLENGLLKLLSQEHPQFEIVVVNDCCGPDVDDDLEILSRQHPNLKHTTLKKDDRFNHSRKIPLLIGIRAASYDNILISHIDASPSSNRWLSFMCRGFSGGNLVIGYTGFEAKKGVANALGRCDRLATSIRYLRSSIKGLPYRGMYNNIGYTKAIFFDNRGYANLSMTIGEDDIFIQRIAPSAQTSTIINPQSTLRQQPYHSIRAWWADQRYRSYGFRYYPQGVKFKTSLELLTRLLLGATALLMGALTLLDLVAVAKLWIVVASLAAIREIVLIVVLRKITRRLGERKLMFKMIIYDFIAPILETILAISRRTSPPKNLWLQNSK